MMRSGQRRFPYNDICRMRFLNTTQECPAVRSDDLFSDYRDAYPSEDGLHVWQIANVNVSNETSFLRFHVTSGVVDRFVTVGDKTLSCSDACTVVFFRELWDGESAVVVYHTSPNDQTASSLRLLYCDIDQRKRLIKVRKQIAVRNTEQKLEYCFVGATDLYMIFRDDLPIRTFATILAGTDVTVNRDVHVYRLNVDDLQLIREFSLSFPAADTAAQDDLALPLDHPARPPVRHRVCAAFERRSSLYVAFAKWPLHIDEQSELDVDSIAAAFGQLDFDGISEFLGLRGMSGVSVYRRRLIGASADDHMQVVELMADERDYVPKGICAIGAVAGELLAVDLNGNHVYVWRLGFVDDDDDERQRMRWHEATKTRASVLFGVPRAAFPVEMPARYVVLPGRTVVVTLLASSQQHAASQVGARRYNVIDLAHPNQRRLKDLCIDSLLQHCPRLPSHVNTDREVPQTSELYCQCASYV